MTKNLGNLDPLNEDKFFEEFKNLEEDAREEKVRSILKERNDIADTNRKLFARAKEAEGFKQDEEGTWTKDEKKPKADSVKSDDKLLERLDNMAKNMAGITAGAQEELFNKWKTETGREADDIIGNSIFQKELGELKTAEANQKATSNIKGEQGESGVKNTPDYWIAKATKGPDGNLLFSDETPKELYSEILKKLAANEPGNSEELKFYNTK